MVVSIMEYNVILAGVGGQGLITLARVIASTLLMNNVNSIIAETHGMSQRGGSVNVHIRVGDALSPLSPVGGTHMLVGLELIEAVRAAKYIRRDGIVLLNNYILKPGIPGVKMPSREELISVFKENNLRYYIIPAQKLAKEAGNVIVANIVMFGAMVALNEISGLDKSAAKEVLSGLRFKEINLRAFELGYKYVLEEFK
ncbi:MAG TPA: indolepyruvate ferredoxin oxidoreductase [Thermoprotei archaeon]|nr:indolepyruvate ferredoxin oxidoreductase [Thermoprotei archaeon]